jgi:hypothetical protein
LNAVENVTEIESLLDGFSLLLKSRMYDIERNIGEKERIE